MEWKSPFKGRVVSLKSRAESPRLARASQLHRLITLVASSGLTAVTPRLGDRYLFGYTGDLLITKKEGVE